jgi:hypothetical protein
MVKSCRVPEAISRELWQVVEKRRTSGVVKKVQTAYRQGSARSTTTVTQLSRCQGFVEHRGEANQGGDHTCTTGLTCHPTG